MFKFKFKKNNKKTVKIEEENLYMLILGSLYEYAGKTDPPIKDSDKNPIVWGRPESIAHHVIDRISWPNEQ